MAGRALLLLQLAACCWSVQQRGALRVPGSPRSASHAHGGRCEGKCGSLSAAAPARETEGPLANFSAGQNGTLGLYVVGATLRAATLNTPAQCAELCLRRQVHDSLPRPACPKGITRFTLIRITI